MTIKAAFLDFYGTLVHEDDAIIAGICREIAGQTRDIDAKTVGAVWSEHFTSLYKAAHGETFDTQRALESSSLNWVAQHFGVELRDGVDSELFAYWQRPEIFDDTRSFLFDVPQHVTTCVVSNIDTDDLNAAIEHHGLVFDSVVTSESAKSYKPNAHIFDTALQVMNVEASEALHIGDSLSSDVAGAEAIGIKTVWLNRGRKALRPGYSPDYVVNDLAEVSVLFH